MLKLTDDELRELEAERELDERSHRQLEFELSQTRRGVDFMRGRLSVWDRVLGPSTRARAPIKSTLVAPKQSTDIKWKTLRLLVNAGGEKLNRLSLMRQVGAQRPSFKSLISELRKDRHIAKTEKRVRITAVGAQYAIPRLVEKGMFP